MLKVLEVKRFRFVNSVVVELSIMCTQSTQAYTLIFSKMMSFIAGN